MSVILILNKNRSREFILNITYANFHFRHCIKDMFNENIDVLDFESEPELCRVRINELVEDVTKNNIQELLPAGSIRTDTNIVLLNAASFKGTWAAKFDKGNTKKKIFYQHGQLPVYVEMMKQKGNFNYGVIDRLKTAFLEMPYQGEHGSMSMFVLLPVFTPTAINELLETITPEILDEVLNNQSIEEVTVEFPKISFERKFKLVPVSEIPFNGAKKNNWKKIQTDQIFNYSSRY